MELTARKKRILRAIIETYIATAEPVGSKAVMENAGLDVSSATIRNEMADLTEMGLLEQPTRRQDGFLRRQAIGCTSMN